MMTLHHGNRLERLARALADVLARPAGGPLEDDVVLVPNAGMARWLALRLADATQLCTAVRFRQPSAFWWETFRTLLPELPEASPFDREPLTWRLAALLGRLPGGGPFDELLAYLAAGLDRTDAERRRFQLAGRLAELYEQYAVYRPQWLLDWEDGRDPHWQAELWRELARGTDRRHRARLQREIAAALERGLPAAADLPERICVFGLPALPPADLWLLRLLARRVDVHVFLANPCAEHPGAVRTARQIAWVARQRDPATLHVEVGHPLYASLGRQGREFFELVLDAADDQHDYFETPPDDTLLGCLQADVLRLRSRGQSDVPAIRLHRDDRSIQLHVCHSAMREVEVLHDQLLALFAEQPGLQPSDVVVMTPDVETYAPCVEAVFGAAPPERRLRYSVADRSRRAEEPVVAAFLALLDLGRSRCEVDRLVQLLEMAAVRRRFALLESDLDTIHAWIRDAAIRWGADAEARGDLGLPATGEHTWRFGLDRLLLGYAVPGEGRRLVHGVLPCDDVEGKQARALGALARFADAAAALERELRVPGPVAAWAERLSAMLERFCAPDDTEEAGAQAVRDELDAMDRAAALAGHTEPVPIDVVAARLREGLERGESGGRFLSGGVTVCGMVPMRSVPFQVVCLLGLDVGSFPRTRRSPAWDRMAEQPCFGDRARRDDDRTLFLEAILSARRRLHVSWVGRGIRDNEAIEPSVLVTELLDHLRQAFLPPAGVESIERHLVVEHPLQPFSREYFRPDRTPSLFSFSESLCAASRALGHEVTSSTLVPARLPPLGDDARTVTIDRLVRFFAHPARCLLQERLGVRLEGEEPPLDAREPFALAGLERWRLDDELLAMRLGEAPAEPVECLLRARGALPHGALGDAVLRARRAEVEDFAGRVEHETGGCTPGRREGIVLDLDGLRLVGELHGVGRRGIVGWRIAKLKPKDRLSLWIRHLVLQAVDPCAEVHSVWLASGRELRVGGARDARGTLEMLLALYWEGMQRLLPFAPASSFEWARAASPEQARWTSARQWAEGLFPECDDRWYRAAWRTRSPLDEPDFGDVARAVYGPLLAVAQETS